MSRRDWYRKGKPTLAQVGGDISYLRKHRPVPTGRGDVSFLDSMFNLSVLRMGLPALAVSPLQKPFYCTSEDVPTDAARQPKPCNHYNMRYVPPAARQRRLAA